MKNTDAKLETIKIGSTSCTFLRTEDFFKICMDWMDGSGVYHVVTLNPEMVLLAERDDDFRDAMNSAQMRVPDGAGIIWARWYLRSKEWLLWSSLFAFMRQPVERITGVDAVKQLASVCARKKRALYLIGGSAQAVSLTAKKLEKDFPGLKVLHSLDHIYEATGPQQVFEKIEANEPGAVLVAYGAPKQTIWIEANRDRMTKGMVVMGVGGAFDIMSETLPRAPKWLRKNNLEWMWRLYLEPKRMPRIWRAVVKFPRLMAQHKKKVTR